MTVEKQRALERSVFTRQGDKKIDGEIRYSDQDKRGKEGVRQR